MPIYWDRNLHSSKHPPNVVLFQLSQSNSTKKKKKKPENASFPYNVFKDLKYG